MIAVASLHVPTTDWCIIGIGCAHEEGSGRGTKDAVRFFLADGFGKGGGGKHHWHIHVVPLGGNIAHTKGRAARKRVCDVSSVFV